METEIVTQINLSFKHTKEILEKLTIPTNAEYSAAFQKILNCTGRIIFTGIGKSALVCKKVVATFNSLGTQAAFLHTNDALHGDVAMVSENDLIFIVSKSGGGNEINHLIKFADNNNINVIALVNQKNAPLLAKIEDVFVLPIEKEASLNNIAPTTSSAIQMIFLDAIAVALAKIRGFSVNDFAKVHPLGSLGKKLNFKVKDLLSKYLPKVSLTENLKNIIYEISSNRIGATAVLNENEEVVGIITDGDLRRMLEENEKINNILAEKIMTKNPKKINANKLAIDAVNTMKKYKIAQLLVEENNEIIGFIHLQDILNEGIE